MSDLISCPVCNWVGLNRPPYTTWPPDPDMVLTPPYMYQLGMPTYEVCVRCGYEFGFDDDPGEEGAETSFEEYRAKWIAKGKPWLNPLTGQSLGFSGNDTPSDPEE
jgi:hypothetical protein